MAAPLSEKGLCIISAVSPPLFYCYVYHVYIQVAHNLCNVHHCEIQRHCSNKTMRLLISTIYQDFNGFIYLDMFGQIKVTEIKKIIHRPIFLP